MSAAMAIEGLGKSFRVPHAQHDHDPRREQLSRRRDLFHALTDISFEVARGETVGLIGPNGSGKSTLLKILSGVMTPDAGKFRVDGRVGALLELGAGFHDDLTGIENVYLNGALLGMSEREVTQLLPEIIEFAELERFMDMPVRHFSSGMTARLGFAVASRLAPEILLMDETFAAGDANFQSKALAHLGALKARGHTLLLVSHNMELILELCDRVIWLDHGRIQTIGAPEEVLREYRKRQKLGLQDVDRMRHLLAGYEMFEPRTPHPGFEITSARAARLREGIAGDWMDEGALELEFGEGLLVELEVRRTDGAAGDCHVETAWTRGDGPMAAQSRTKVEFGGQGSSARVRLRFDPWPLVLEQAGPVFVPAEPAGYGVPFAPRFSVNVVTPNPYELPVMMHLDHRWRVDD